jgi:acyl dehydratase
MSASNESLVLGQINEGDQLPELHYDVSATTVVLGAMAARDWRPMHHDKDFAVNRNGTKDIFLNTPNQAAWFERYLTDWTGPKGRLGKIQFRMKASVFPGDTMIFSGSVTNVDTDDAGCGWATLDVRLTAEDRVVTDCTAKVALPLGEEDNPWKRVGEEWKP